MSAIATKNVYVFGNGQADGNKEMKAHLGGKGANLAEMSAIGLPVPPGFTISTECCRYYNDHGKSWPDSLEGEVREGIDHIAKLMNTGFGDANNPLLVSV